MKRLLLILLFQAALLTVRSQEIIYEEGKFYGNVEKTDVSGKDGSGSQGNIFNQTDCGLSYVQVSHTLDTRNLSSQQNNVVSLTQPAAYNISGIPTCAEILKAYVWWSTSGSNTSGSVTVQNPSGNSSTYNVNAIGTGVDKCWSSMGYSSTYSFRADVTSIITGTYNGNYYLSGLPTGSPDDVDGATLMIIYKTPNASYEGTLVINDGAMVSNTYGTSYTQVMSGFTVCNTPLLGKGFIIVSDFQSIFPPHDVTINGVTDTATGNFWDYIERDITTGLTAGQTSSNYGIYTGSDCYDYMVSGLYYQCPSSGCIVTSTLGASVNTTNNNSCSDSIGTATVTVTGGTGPYNYIWSTVPAQYTATATDLPAGTFYVTVTDNACNAVIDTAIITAAAAPSVDAGANVDLCNGSSTTLNATASGGTPGYTFQWSPALGLNNPNISNPVASPTVTTNYSVTVSDVNSCIGVDMVTVNVITVIPEAGPDTSLCDGNSVALQASGGTNYIWSPAGTLNNSTISGPVASPTTTTTYTVTVSTGICSETDNVVVTVFPVAAEAGNDTAICIGASATLHGSGGTSYLWSTGAATQNIVVTPDTATTYYLTVTSGICPKIDSVKVSIASPPVADFTYVLTPDCDGIKGVFTNTSSNSDSVRWLFSNGFTTTANAFNITFNYGDSVDITLIADNGGCKDLKVEPNPLHFTKSIGLPPPNVFTPNNDSYNDCFKLITSPGFEDCYSMVVFNRWGKKVFEKSTDHKCWDGRDSQNNNPVSDGVYFYIITVGEMEYSGTVTLIRN